MRPFARDRPSSVTLQESVLVSARFDPPHPDALDPEKCRAVVEAIKGVLAGLEAEA